MFILKFQHSYKIVSSILVTICIFILQELGVKANLRQHAEDSSFVETPYFPVVIAGVVVVGTGLAILAIACVCR